MLQSSILEEIALSRKNEVAINRQKVTLKELEHRIQQIELTLGKPLSVMGVLQEKSPNLAFAAEFKRASPSKGDIRIDQSPTDMCQMYADAGVAIISVLTEPNWFKGSLEDLFQVRNHLKSSTKRPAILRKDFIIDEYQLYEARAYGADTILLIVALLDIKTLTRFIQKSRELGMEPLVEVNNVDELDIALAADSRLIGVNNRNLHTFQLDMETTDRIVNSLKERKIQLGKDGVFLLALSGVSCREDIIKYEQLGIRGVLIGEMLMKSTNATELIKSLAGDQVVKDSQHPSVHLKKNELIVKICGITDKSSALLAARNGANLIGMIFAEKSSRRVDLPTAQSIVSAIQAFGERSSSSSFLENNKNKKDLDSETASSPSQWFTEKASWMKIVTRKYPLTVGVFANQSVGTINSIVEQVGLDLVQLHGDEGYEICQEICVPCIRVVHVDVVDSPTKSLELIQSIQSGYAVVLLLDTSIQGNQGGTGVSFDWKIAKTFQDHNLPVILAGGLNPKNVAECIQIAQPFGIDVSSGLEEVGHPGKKDESKVKDFFKAVQCASIL